MRLLGFLFLSIFTIFVTGCSGGGGGGGSPTVSSDGVVLSDQSIIVDDADTIDAIVEFDDQSGELEIEGLPEELNNVSVGKVLVLGETSATPNGLLKKVTEVRTEDGNTIIVTENAQLTDVITDGKINVTGKLDSGNASILSSASSSISYKSRLKGVRMMSSSNFATSSLFEDVFDGCDEETSEFYVGIDAVEVVSNVELNGCVSFSIPYELGIDIKKTKIEELKFTISPTIKSELSASSTTEIEFNDEEVLLTSVTLPKIIFLIGIVPVVIVPELDIVLGVDGKVTVNLIAGVTADASAEVGIRYKDDIWQPVAERSLETNFVEPTLYSTMTASISTGPNVNFLLYGVAGPGASLRAYVTLDADIELDPWWSLYAGINAGAQVKVELFDNTLLDQDFPDLINLKRIIAEAEAGITPFPDTPSISSAIAGSDKVTITWGAVSNASSYNLYWSTFENMGLSANKVQNVQSPFEHLDLTGNTTYYYTLEAANPAGESELSSEVSTLSTTTSEEENGLITYYSFDGDANDESGNNLKE